MHDQCDVKSNGFGYRDPDGNFRTIMAYDCINGTSINGEGKANHQCDAIPGVPQRVKSCPRVQV